MGQLFREKLRTDNRSSVSIFKVLYLGIKLNIRIVPFFFCIKLILNILHGVSFGFVTFVTQSFYDTIGASINGIKPLSQVYIIIVVLGLALIARDVLNGVCNFLYEVIYSKLKGETEKIIHGKIARVDPICLEDTKVQDDINKASEGSAAIYEMVNIGVSTFTFHLPYFIFMGFYLCQLKPQFIFAIVLVFVPVLLSQFIRVGIIARFEDKVAPIRREYTYYSDAIVKRENLKETRILGGYNFFFKQFLATLQLFNKAKWKSNVRNNLLEIFVSFFSAAGYVGILYMLVTALLNGEITIGAFAAVFSSIGLLFNMMNEMINYHISNMALNIGKAHNFIRFMDVPDRSNIEAVPDFGKGIIAENVSFTYPNAVHKSVDGVSIKIKAGETVAIVGENGAGKTSLVRLLIGLYIPTEGKIMLHGMDTALTSGKSIFSGVSGVFQKFQRYHMTLQENIQISDSNSSSAVDTSIEQADVEINGESFPNGVDTMLSREFGGIDLSGGEWQRVAIARGLYRMHNVIVLDEPTAAIDPIEESRIYKKFMEISKDKTSIIVTHRLGAVKIADRVIVMDKGRIVEAGTHNELLERHGLYARMYQLQAGWYQSDELIPKS